MTALLQCLKLRRCIGLAVLLIALSILAGCSTGGKAIPEKIMRTAADQKAAVPAVPAGPSVEWLEDGREGFVIREVPRMGEASRRDFDLAVAMLKEKNYSGAIELLEKVIAQSPGATAPYIDIAIAYRRIDKPEQAEEHLKTALGLVPGHPVACNEYGLLYRQTGRFAEAKAMYEHALARFPDYYPAHRNLGILCDLYLNDPTCALEHYKIYSALRPEDKQVKLWIADLRMRLGK